MKDAWNTDGVSWSNATIERELAKVMDTGRELANRFLRHKLMLLAAVAMGLIFCVYFLDSLTGLAVELVLLFVVMNYLKKAARKAQAPAYEFCDPYLEFAYIRAYAEHPLPKSRVTVVRQVLSLAQCMALAGEPQAAISIQSLLAEPDQLRPVERGIYYNTLLLSYGLYGWTDKRRTLVEKLRRCKEEAGKREGLMLERVLRTEELRRRQDMGDIEFVEDYYKKIPPVYRFQEVGMHYTLGMMYMKEGDAERAREHVEFVLDKGNKLYYKRDMEDYLRGSLAGQDDDERESMQREPERRERQAEPQMESECGSGLKRHKETAKEREGSGDEV